MLAINIIGMRKSTIATTFILFCTFCYGQETKTFKKDNISFEYPIHWITRDFPGYYILISEPSKDQISVLTTFDVAFEEGYKTLKQYCKTYEKRVKTNEQFKDFKIKMKKKIKFKGMEAIEYNCTATALYLPIEWKSIIFLKNGKIFKLSTTSMIDQFFLQKGIIEKIYESFQIE